MIRSALAFVLTLLLSHSVTAQSTSTLGFRAANSKQGVVIITVNDKGIASQMALGSGDIIKKIGTTEIATVKDLDRAMANLKASDLVFEIESRSGKTRVIKGRIHNPDDAQKALFIPKFEKERMP